MSQLIHRVVYCCFFFVVLFFSKLKKNLLWVGVAQNELEKKDIKEAIFLLNLRVFKQIKLNIFNSIKMQYNLMLLKYAIVFLTVGKLLPLPGTLPFPLVPSVE